MGNKNDLNRWIFEIPLSDIQNSEMPETSTSNSCLCCGKKIKDVNNWIHLLTNGNIVSSDQEFDNSQGFFPIGNECKNRIPNNFYFKLDL